VGENAAFPSIYTANSAHGASTQREKSAHSGTGPMLLKCDHRYSIGSDWLNTIRTPGPSSVPKSGSCALSGSPANASAANVATA
jgi:hypothetical protein